MKFFKTIGDFFLDKQNNGDEKRFLGVAFLVAALVYAFLSKPDAGVLTVLCTTGTGLLVTAAATDGIKGGQ